MSNKWNLRYLNLAKHVSTWSKDPSTKVGAVIVDPVTKSIVGLGYNGFPRGVNDDEERYAERELKYKYVVHAELNAILNSNKSVRGCEIYVYPTLGIPPACPECAKAIVQAGIVAVHGFVPKKLEERWHSLTGEYSKNIFDKSGVRIICEEVE